MIKLIVSFYNSDIYNIFLENLMSLYDLPCSKEKKYAGNEGGPIEWVEFLETIKEIDCKLIALH